MWIKRQDKMWCVKTGGKLGTGEYSPIIPQLFTAETKGIGKFLNFFYFYY